MSETLQLEEAIQLHDAPKLLVEWSSPWREFVSSVRPALAHSEARLAGEAPFGLIPYRISIPTYLLEAFLILAAVVIQAKIAEMRPYVAPRLSSHDVIYYSGDELPRTEDLGGAEAGTMGGAGGDEAHHHTQTIKIARGGKLVERVVDAPNLKLPYSHDAVANLLAIRPDAGPPPSEGLRSARTAPNLAATLIAPSPTVIRDYTRNGIRLDSVIAPAPAVSRDRSQTAPSLSEALIPPAPDVSSSHALVAPLLVPAVIPPAPSVSRDHAARSPSLSTSVVAPAPSVEADKARSTPTLAANVIPPAPAALNREISSAPVQMTNPAVIPPPVSAPERATTRDSKLNLPAPAVVAPPPSADISHDMRRLASGSVPDPSKTVVPPPPTQSGSGSFMSSIIGKIFGASEVVPPPPSVTSSSSGRAEASLATNVVPPPPAVTGTGGDNPHGSRGGTSATLTGSVVAPPPSVGASESVRARSTASSSASALGPPSVVPPPPSLAGEGGGTGEMAGGAGAPGGRLANNVVPPPPSIGGGAGAAGSGLGRKGTGLGAPLDAGSNLAAPTAGGSGANSGTVVSTQPGPKVGLPTTGGTGSLALSPSGGEKAGLGGAGGGGSIGRGSGSGSGMNGAGPGAGKTGSGRGSDPGSSGGISPTAGPGGAGNTQSGAPPVRGVDISGGSSVVTLPSFGSDPAENDPPSPNRSSLKPRQSFDVDVVATASSGGPFEPYRHLLHGETHSMYPETYSSLGAAAMEYADESGTGRGTLSAPQPIRTNLPEGLPHARMMVICILDASGNLKNLRVLEPGSAEMTAKIMAALRSWKFQPATRNGQPIEVTAILGFNIDTSDRF